MQLKGDKDTPICGVAKHSCVAKVEKKLLKEAFLESSKDVDSVKKRCNCLPACTSINYDIELSPAEFNLDEFHRGLDPTHKNSM